jgi:hypothetical protein
VAASGLAYPRISGAPDLDLETPHPEVLSAFPEADYLLAFGDLGGFATPPLGGAGGLPLGGVATPPAFPPVSAVGDALELFGPFVN